MTDSAYLTLGSATSRYLTRAAGTQNYLTQAAATDYFLTLNDPLPYDNDVDLLLAEAAWYIDSHDSNYSGGQSVPNMGTAGTALNAQMGSGTAVDSNDPKWLAYEGTPYAYIPAVNNTLTVPDDAARDVTDLDLRLRLALDDWTPGTNVRVWGDGVSDPNRRFVLNVLTGGNLSLTWFPAGTAASQITAASSVATGLSDGAAAWIRVVLDVNDGGVYKVYFYTAPDSATEPSSWTQLGTTVVGGATTTIPNISETAGFNNGGVGGFKAYRAIQKDGIDGTTVLDIDTSVLTSGSQTSFTATTGQTVTINRATSGRKTTLVGGWAGGGSLWLLGSDDYLEVPARWAPEGLYLPGIASNYASTPDAAAVDVTGDLTVDCYVRLPDWTPSTTNTLLAKWTSGGNQRSYLLQVLTDGTLQLLWTTDGATTAFQTSTAAVGATDGSAKWVRACLDVDNGAGAYTVKFYTSDDGSTFSQLGTTKTGASTTSIYSGTAVLEVGTSSAGSTNPMTGTVYRARVYASADGTGSPVFDADFTGHALGATSFTEDSANAATVTINTSGTSYLATLVGDPGAYIRTGGLAPVASATDDLNFGASDSFTVLAVVRLWSGGTYYSGIVAKNTSISTPAGWLLYTDNNSLFIRGHVADGTDQATTPSTLRASTSGEFTVKGMTLSRAEGRVYLSHNGVMDAGTSISAIGSTANATALRVGARASYYADMEFVAAAIWRRALTAGEIAGLNLYFQNRAYNG